MKVRTLTKTLKNPIQFDISLSDEQKEAKAKVLQYPMNFLLGLEGSGKTLLACQIGLDLFFRGEVSQLVITRPAVATESLGHLPGPQPLDAMVLTPEGFVRMGDLRVGDFVIGKSGHPIEITQIRPQGEKMVYRISTSDGRTTEATEDHLWTTSDHNEFRRGAESVKSTKEIAESLKRERSGKIIFNHRLPFHEPVNFPKQELPIDPYVLGVLLGDGSFGTTVTPNLVDFEDGQIFSEVSSRLSDGVELVVSKRPNQATLNQSKDSQRNKVGRKFNVLDELTEQVSTYDSIGDYLECNPNLHRATAHHRAMACSSIDDKTYFFSERDRDYNNPIKQELSKLGLLGLKSYDKFIPEIYLRTSVQDRIDLLRGLMDTDGTCKKNGEATFCTTSKKLAEGVQDIVRSLGGKCIIRQRNRVGRKSGLINGREIVSRRVCYDLQVSPPTNINPFTLRRKATRYANAKFRHGILITKIEPIGVKETQCLVVDSKDHLYLTDDYIVTHNSADEKLAPYLMGIVDNLNKLYGSSEAKKNKIKKHVENGDIKIIPIAFTRSITYDNAVVIVDEMQNLNRSQFEMVLGRLGKTSKLIFTGSKVQIDLQRKDDSAIWSLEKIQNNEYVNICHLTSNHRHPAVESVLGDLRRTL